MENGHPADAAAVENMGDWRSAVDALAERVGASAAGGEPEVPDDGETARRSYQAMNCVALMEDDEELDAPKTVAYQPGQLVMQEMPFAAVVNTDLAASVCHRCWKRGSPSELSALKRCSRCHFARYCDDRCAQTAWKGHKLECALLAAYSKETGLVPDALIRLLNLVLMKVHNGNVTGAVDACAPPTQRSFHSLCSHTAEIDAELGKSDKFQRNMLEIQRFIAASPLAAQLEPALIAETYSRVLTNSIAITDRRGTALGVGLYLGISQFDHSCLPNALYFCQEAPPRLSVLAIRPIPSIKEVRISYVNPMKPTVERRGELKESYYFVCQCGRCQGVEQDGMGRALACKAADCTGGYVLLGKDWKPMGPCPLCGQRMGNRDVGLQQGRDLMQTVLEFVGQQEGNFTGEPNGPRPSAEQVHILKSLADECAVHLFKLNYYRTRLNILLADYHLLLQSDAEKALPVLEDLAEAYEFYLGPVSMALCETLLRTATAYLSGQQWRRAAQKALRAWQIVRVLYAQGDPFVGEVRSILGMCLERLGGAGDG